MAETMAVVGGESPETDALPGTDTREADALAGGEEDFLSGVELLTEDAAPVGVRPNEASDAHAHAQATPKADFDLPQWMGALEITAPTRIAQNISRPLYTWCTRPTHSDVTCISNTTHPYNDLEMNGNGAPLPPASRKSSDPRCRLPYSDGATVQISTKANTSTLLSQKMEAKARMKMNRELHMERDAFMERLRQEREGRLESEVGAATSIQSAFRGYATRPHAESVVTMKDIRREKALKGEATIETAMLKDLDIKLGLKPIPGVTLNPPKKKMTKKQKRLAKKRAEEQEAGALKLQSMLRVKTANEKTAKLRDQKERREANNAAFMIQRSYRGYQGRQGFKQKRECESATLIQQRFRVMTAKARVKDLKEDAIQKKREDMAASALQAAARGRRQRSAGDDDGTKGL
eukprot:CAMPEP_0182568466 /NCGR_PEP_ID=MMETSP1324-20130603/9396_1 /TAXON_ID=236786 /ORGANISM="Florenciella sp., Strain RCC1587" /LENGTH=406 /DNA_ID=CAMNT_0024782611 /DNA_START=111 /DNA_END=1331 /DNA_ORIENTATION=+